MENELVVLCVKLNIATTKIKMYVMTIQRYIHNYLIAEFLFKNKSQQLVGVQYSSDCFIWPFARYRKLNRGVNFHYVFIPEKEKWSCCL